MRTEWMTCMVTTRATKNSKKKERLIQTYVAMATSLPECAPHLCMQYSRVLYLSLLCPRLLSRNRTIQECIVCCLKLTAEKCVCALSLGPRYRLQCRTEVLWAGGCPACALFLINHNATSKLFHQGCQLSGKQTFHPFFFVLGQHCRVFIGY